MDKVCAAEAIVLINLPMDLDFTDWVLGRLDWNEATSRKQFGFRNFRWVFRFVFI